MKNLNMLLTKGKKLLSLLLCVLIVCSCFALIFTIYAVDDSASVIKKYTFDAKEDMQAGSSYILKLADGTSASTPNSSAFGWAEDTSDLVYNCIYAKTKDSRMNLFNTSGVVDTFDAGTYRISFKYRWTTNSVSGGSTDNGYFGFGVITNFEEYANTTSCANYVQDKNLYSDCRYTNNNWISAVNYLTVETDNSYIALCASATPYTVRIDDVIITKISDDEILQAGVDTYNFDYGKNNGSLARNATLSGMTAGNTISGIFYIKSTSTENGNALYINNTANRVWVLNNGNDPLYLPKGEYNINFKYLLNTNAELAGTSPEIGFGVLGTALSNYKASTDSSNVNNKVGITEFSDDGWENAVVKLSVTESNSIIALYSNNLKFSTFIDDIKIEKISGSEYFFDFSDNTVMSTSADDIVSGGGLVGNSGTISRITSVSGVFRISNGTLRVNNKDNRMLPFNLYGEAITLNEGTYKISFKYRFDSTAISSGSTSYGHFGFGVANFSDYAATAAGSRIVQMRNYFSEYKAVNNDWVESYNYITVAEGGGVLGLCVNKLSYNLYLDDISIVPVDSNTTKILTMDHGGISNIKLKGNTLNMENESGDKVSAITANTDIITSGSDSTNDPNSFWINVTGNGDKIDLINEDGTVIPFAKGIYKISARYKGDGNVNGYFGFGTLTDFTRYADVATGSAYIQQKNTFNAASDWTRFENILIVDDDNTYIGLCVNNCNGLMLDDIVIEKVKEYADDPQIYNFDSGKNSGMLVESATLQNSQGLVATGSAIFKYTYLLDTVGEDRINTNIMVNSTGYAPRMLLLNDGTYATEFSAGKYKITYEYYYRTDKAITYSESENYTGEEVARFGFGVLDNFADYSATLNGLNTMVTECEIDESTDSRTEATCEITVLNDGSYIGICTAYLKHYLVIDNIRVEYIGTGSEQKIEFDESYTDKGFAVTDDYFIVSDAGLWCSEFIEQLKYSSRLTIESSGMELNNLDVPLATGMKLRLSYNGAIVDTKTIIVGFDINGDGYDDIRDLVCLKKSISDLTVDTDLYKVILGVDSSDNAAYLVAERKHLLFAVPSYTQHAFSINNYDISNYKIVVPGEASLLWSEQPEKLARTVKKYTGKEIEIIDENIAASEYEILIGATNREITADCDPGCYVIAVQGSKLVINGKSSNDITIDEAIYAGIKAFEEIVKTSVQISGTVTGQVILTDADYVCAFADEFDTLNTSIWGDLSWNNASDFEASALNGASAYNLDSEKCYVKDGNLYLPTSYDSETNTFYQSQVTTEGRLTTQYGLIEIRAKLADLPATSALWASSQYGNNKVLEIDLLENFGKSGSVSNLHTNGVQLTAENRGYYDDDLTGKYFIYSVRWTPELIEYAINGKVFHCINLDENILYSICSNKNLYWCFGTTCGTVKYANDEKVVNTTIELMKSGDFEKKLIIDYFRVYECEDIGGKCIVKQ